MLNQTVNILLSQAYTRCSLMQITECGIFAIIAFLLIGNNAILKLFVDQISNFEIPLIFLRRAAHMLRPIPGSIIHDIMDRLNQFIITGGAIPAAGIQEIRHTLVSGAVCASGIPLGHFLISTCNYSFTQPGKTLSDIPTRALRYSFRNTVVTSVTIDKSAL